MRRALVIFLAVICLSGCTKNNELDMALTLRDNLLKSNGCKFEAVVTADYGEQLYTFSMDCQSDQNGTVTFSVLEPDSIRGITGTISADGGNLTFDDHVLAFPLLADGQVSPVSAPWLFIKTLMGGYLTACGKDGDLLKIAIDDSYEENALHLEIWTDNNTTPVQCEILFKGSRVLSAQIKNFVLL